MTARLHRLRLGEVRRIVVATFGHRQDLTVRERSSIAEAILNAERASKAPDRALASARAWCEMNLPAIESEDLRREWEVVSNEPQMRARDFGVALDVSAEDRRRLRAFTIHPHDVEFGEMKRASAERRRAADRERKARARAEAGRVDRETWLADSKSAARPWEAEGVSRAQWYRRRSETGVSARKRRDTVVEQPVSSCEADRAPLSSQASLPPLRVDSDPFAETSPSPSLSSIRKKKASMGSRDDRRAAVRPDRGAIESVANPAAPSPSSTLQNLAPARARRSA